VRPSRPPERRAVARRQVARPVASEPHGATTATRDHPCNAMHASEAREGVARNGRPRRWRRRQRSCGARFVIERSVTNRSPYAGTIRGQPAHAEPREGSNSPPMQRSPEAAARRRRSAGTQPSVEPQPVQRPPTEAAPEP
jgi:hypothetical protein